MASQDAIAQRSECMLSFVRMHAILFEPLGHKNSVTSTQALPPPTEQGAKLTNVPSMADIFGQCIGAG